MSFWSTPNLQIGNVVFDIPKALSLTQSYEFIGGVTRLRAGDGTQKTQAYWTRLKTVMNGEGFVSPAALGIDWTAPQTVKCANPLSLESSSNVQALPAARRSDIPPAALAWVDGFPVPTPVAMAGNVATATLVANASLYTFEYWPEISAFLTLSQANSRPDGKVSWTITAEEI